MRARIFSAMMLALLLAGCASTGIVPIGQDTYMLTKKSPACGFASAEGTKADLYLEANAFCAERKKQIQTVEAIARDGVPFVRCASAELHFRCVDEDTTKNRP